MNIPTNSKKIIKEIAKGEWYLLTKRTDIPILPVWLKMKASATNLVAKKMYGNFIPWASFWHDNECELYIHGNEFRKAAFEITKLLYSYKRASEHLLKTASLCEEAREEAREFYKPDWKKYSDEQLLNVYLKIVQKYTSSFIYGFVTWCSQVLQSNAKKNLKRYEEKLSKNGINIDEALGVLIISNLPNLYKDKEIALDRLAKFYKSKKDITKNSLELKNKIKKFLNEFEWVGYEYNGPTMSGDKVLKEILQRKNEKRKSIDKKKIINLCKFNKKEIESFNILALLTHIKDERNVSDDFIHYCFNNFYNEIARRYKLSINDVRYLWDDEMEDLLRGKRKFSKKYFKDKRSSCYVVTTVKKHKVEISYKIGKEAENLKNEVYNSSHQKEKLSTKKITGTVASTGVVVGKAKLIRTYSDMSKIKRGDILVAYMTSQKFMPAIMKAGAIVTNEGGLTCHAAIVAREVSKPCIIGTKVAMEIIKDGDMLKVDANKGVVEILKS